MAGYTMLDLMHSHPAAVPVAWYEIDPARADTAERIGLLKARGIQESPTLASLLSREDLDVIANVTPHYALGAVASDGALPRRTGGDPSHPLPVPMVA